MNPITLYRVLPLLSIQLITLFLFFLSKRKAVTREQVSSPPKSLSFCNVQILPDCMVHVANNTDRLRETVKTQREREEQRRNPAGPPRIHICWGEAKMWWTRQLNNHNSLFLYSDRNKNKRHKRFKTEQHPLWLPSFHPFIQSVRPGWCQSLFWRSWWRWWRRREQKIL